MRIFIVFTCFAVRPGCGFPAPSASARSGVYGATSAMVRSTSPYADRAIMMLDPPALQSRLHHHLDRLALVHRPVTVGYPVEADDPVEDAAGLDPTFEDVR